MASGRFLDRNKFIKYQLLFIAIVGFVAVGCSTSSKVVGKKLPTPPGKSGDAKTLSKGFKQTLNETRTQADDVFAVKDKTPAYFLKKKETDKNKAVGNPYTGFRVQLISTRDISAAKAVADSFRVWAGQHIIGYYPQAYITFDQPYYKVHVGNFQFYKRAVKFTQLLKSEYPGAWVIHDRINPEAVPEGEIKKIKK